MNMMSALINKDTITSEYRDIFVLDIDDVSVNPRYVDNVDGVVFNERYEELKESINSTNGKYLVLEVVPNEHDPGRYTIFKGGSTRLRIAKVLYEHERVSGNENNYEKIRCIVYPKIEDSVKLVMTATENITRGDLCYGEKARALQYIVEAFNLDRNNRAFNLTEFLEYVELIGAKAMVFNTREFYLLQQCYDEFLAVNVLSRRIIEGRANREFIRGVVSIKSKFIGYCDDNDIDNCDMRWTSICESIDDEKLTLKTLENCIGKFKSDIQLDRSEEVSSITGVDGSDGDTTENVDVAALLGDDPKTNASLIIEEIATTGQYKSSRRKTSKLKSMGVENDLSGFIKLLKMIPKKDQKAAVEKALSNTSL